MGTVRWPQNLVCAWLSAGSSMAAAASASVTVAWFGVAAPVLFASFAGVMLILSCLPRPEGGDRRLVLVLLGVACSTLGGGYAAPFVARWLFSELLSAFMAAALIYALPFLVRHRQEILDVVRRVRTGGGQ